MKRTLSGVLAAILLLLPASFLPAKAGVLYSLTGVVGDSNWSRFDSAGDLAIFPDLSSVFQANGGPGGFITIDFSGPPFLGRRDQLSYENISLTATCLDTAGCVNGDGYGYIYFNGGHLEGCCLLSGYPIDSSLHVQDLEIPPFAPYQASFEGYTKGYIDYTIFGFVAPDTVGQPFSLTVSTIPEPSSLALLLAGLGAIGGIFHFRHKKVAVG